MGLILAGSTATIGYSATIIWLLNDRFSQLLIMPLNEVGDFLAGVFGPLAIFWLILGFLQQGKELQHSTEALELQAKELNNSVQQQKELVEVSRQQMEAEIASTKVEHQRYMEAAQPCFVFQSAGGTHTGDLSKLTLKFKNTGSGITNVSLTVNKDIKLSPTKIPSWEKNLDKEVMWEYMKGESEDTADISIKYKDSLGNNGEQIFVISVDPNEHHPTPEIHKKN